MEVIDDHAAFGKFPVVRDHAQSGVVHAGHAGSRELPGREFWTPGEYHRCVRWRGEETGFPCAAREDVHGRGSHCRTQGDGVQVPCAPGVARGWHDASPGADDRSYRCSGMEGILYHRRGWGEARASRVPLPRRGRQFASCRQLARRESRVGSERSFPR